jgi:hypothetical protein
LLDHADAQWGPWSGRLSHLVSIGLRDFDANGGIRRPLGHLCYESSAQGQLLGGNLFTGKTADGVFRPNALPNDPGLLLRRLG